jgi:hypothetical protein
VRGEGPQGGLHLPECPVNAPRGAGSRRCRHGRWRIQGAPRRWTPKGQGAGGPWGGAIRLAPHRHPKAQGNTGAGRPPGGNLLLVPAAREAPAALRP